MMRRLIHCLLGFWRWDWILSTIAMLMIMVVVVMIMVGTVAAVPQEILYQGRVLDAGGQPLNGSATNVLRVYDGQVGTNVLWSQTNLVTMTNGYYAFEFGNVALDSVLTNSTCWLAVELDGIVMTPRKRLTTVPYALRAAVAERLTVPLAGVPSGGIAMWSGTLDDIPEGWVLCDGQNGTPDLRERFVMGAATTNQVGMTGGVASYNLTVNQLPAHTHTASSSSAGEHTHTASTGSAGNHSHSASTGSAGNHSHTFRVANSWGYVSAHVDEAGGSSGGNAEFNTSSAGNHSHSVSIGSGGAHSHAITINSAGSHSHNITIDATGDGESVDNLPAYYVMAFVMKQ